MKCIGRRYELSFEYFLADDREVLVNNVAGMSNDEKVHHHLVKPVEYRSSKFKLNVIANA
jgi:hypothetical protein